MTLYKAVSTLPYTTGLPRDIATNTTWWITPTPASQDDRDEIGARLIAAYQGFDAYINGLVSRSTDACSVELYDMGAAPPRLPVEEYRFTIGNAGTDYVSLPGEVALVLAYHAAYVSGTPNARKRGRIYLGPVATETLTPTRPGTAMINAAVDFGETLWTPISETDVVWSQRSETTGATSPVAGGWVDNEWDTQRRRGRDATARTLLGAPPS